MCANEPLTEGGVLLPTAAASKLAAFWFAATLATQTLYPLGCTVILLSVRPQPSPPRQNEERRDKALQLAR